MHSHREKQVTTLRYSQPSPSKVHSTQPLDTGHTACDFLEDSEKHCVVGMFSVASCQQSAAAGAEQPFTYTYGVHICWHAMLAPDAGWQTCTCEYYRYYAMLALGEGISCSSAEQYAGGAGPEGLPHHC